jgi:hypothetical protein
VCDTGWEWWLKVRIRVLPAPPAFTVLKTRFESSQGGLNSMWSFVSRHFSVLFLVASLGAIANSQTQPAIDRSAVFKTIVTHRGAPIAGIKAARPVSEGVVAPATTFSGPPYTVGPTFTPTSTVPEAEEHIAVDPSNSNNLVAMISDFSILRAGFFFNTSKFSVSTNNGSSWSESFVPLNASKFPVTSEGHVWQANSDPVVAIDKLGNVYLANLYIQVNSVGNATNDGFYVCSAPMSSGPTFTAASCRPVRTNLNATSVFEDKDWIATDNSTAATSGNVYAIWTHFTASSDMIFFSRSTDHGMTWSTPIQINPASQNGAVQGSQVAVGPAGQVYVSYEVFFAGNKGQHFIAKSTDGGISFGAPVAQTPIFNNLSFGATYRDNSFPALAVSPVVGKGFVYDVYTDQPGASSRTAFVRSKIAGGLVFTTPKRVNDITTGQRLMPAIAADTNGVVHISWFDTRNSGGSTNLLDIFATFTKDNGAIFAPNARVTSTPINAGNAGFIGDYAGIAAGPNGSTNFAHPVWTNGGVGGTTSGQMRTAAIIAP